VLAGRCEPEEGDALLEWLRRVESPAADLSGCSDVHTALVQLLLAARVAIIAPPEDPVFGASLQAHLSVSAPIVPPKPRRHGRRPKRAPASSQVT
jgi:hypothetical protein